MKKILIFLFVGIMSCAPVRFVKPLEKGQKAMGFNAGGPLIHFDGSVIPIPYSSIYGGYGLKDNTTVYAGLHITAAAFKTFQLDAGFSRKISTQDGYKPGISVGSALNFMVKDEFRVYPQLDANLFWEYRNNKWMTYAGTSNWLDLFKGQRVSPENHNYILPEFHLGQTLHLKSLDITLEYKSLFPWKSNKNKVVKYATFGDHGASGIYFGIQKKF